MRLDFSDLVKKFAVDRSSYIQRLTQPLHDYFGSVYFTYHWIDQKGNYYALVDRPDWAEYYQDRRLFQVDPFLCHPDHYRSCVIPWSVKYSAPQIQPILADMQRQFGFNQGLMLIRRMTEAVEMFGIALPDQSGILDRCFSQVGVFELFCDYFKEECFSFVSELKQSPVNLVTLKGDLFTTSLQLENVQSRQRLLRHLGVADLSSAAQSLSPREHQTIRLLCQGHTAQTAAKQLNLSPRTVEYYLENAKDKLGCLNRRELIKHGNQLIKLNF